MTPVPEEADAQARWVSPGQVQAELDELARASKRFLEVSCRLYTTGMYMVLCVGVFV